MYLIYTIYIYMFYIYIYTVCMHVYILVSLSGLEAPPHPSAMQVLVTLCWNVWAAVLVGSVAISAAAFTTC